MDKAFTWKCFQDLDVNTNKLHTQRETGTQRTDMMGDALLKDIFNRVKLQYTAWDYVAMWMCIQTCMHIEWTPIDKHQKLISNVNWVCYLIRCMWA